MNKTKVQLKALLQAVPCLKKIKGDSKLPPKAKFKFVKVMKKIDNEITARDAALTDIMSNLQIEQKQTSHGFRFTFTDDVRKKTLENIWEKGTENPDYKLTKSEQKVADELNASVEQLGKEMVELEDQEIEIPAFEFSFDDLEVLADISTQDIYLLSEINYVNLDDDEEEKTNDKDPGKNA